MSVDQAHNLRSYMTTPYMVFISKLGLWPDPPPPLPHLLHPPAILLKPLPQVNLSFLSLLTVLEPVEVVLDTIVLPPFLQFGLLLLCLFESCRAGTTAAGHGYETVFVGHGAGVLEQLGTSGFERGEL